MFASRVTNRTGNAHVACIRGCTFANKTNKTTRVQFKNRRLLYQSLANPPTVLSRFRYVVCSSCLAASDPGCPCTQCWYSCCTRALLWGSARPSSACRERRIKGRLMGRSTGYLEVCRTLQGHKGRLLVEVRRVSRKKQGEHAQGSRGSSRDGVTAAVQFGKQNTTGG